VLRRRVFEKLSSTLLYCIRFHSDTAYLSRVREIPVFSPPGSPSRQRVIMIRKWGPLSSLGSESGAPEFTICHFQGISLARVVSIVNVPRCPETQIGSPCVSDQGE
jgi:hypothetical protein